MAKLLFILSALLLLSCEEKQQPKQAVAEERPEQIEENPEVLKAKLKEEYEKRFVVPISDFELSVERVEYYWDEEAIYGQYSLKISITRTATGAIARYMGYEIYGPEYELKLNTQEWLDLVNALHKCKVKRKKDIPKTNLDHIHTDLNSRHYLKIWLSSQEELGSFLSEYHLDSAKTLKVMKAMDAKIKKNVVANLAASIEPRLKMEYEKRFVVPISDFELSISGINFRYAEPDIIIEAYRTAKDVYILYMNFILNPHFQYLELDIGDWLDLINALNRCRVNKWKRNYENLNKNLKYFPSTWRLGIEFLDKDKLYFQGTGGYPTNWDEFMKAMEDFRAKIIKKLNAPLEAEYQKKYGERISDFELSTKLIYLNYGHSSDSSIIISIADTSTIVKYTNQLIIKLGIGEWLDFIRALHKLRMNEWEKKYGESVDSNDMLTIKIYPSNGEPDEFKFYDAYPMNWAEFKKIIDDIVEKMEKKAGIR